MMPKGFKSKNGYGSAKQFNGMTYHEISSEMKGHGFKINHSSCRNEFISSLIKIASDISGLYDIKHDDKALKEIAINPDFQDSVRGFLEEIQNERSKNKFST